MCSCHPVWVHAGQHISHLLCLHHTDTVAYITLTRRRKVAPLPLRSGVLTMRASATFRHRHLRRNLTDALWDDSHSALRELISQGADGEGGEGLESNVQREGGGEEEEGERRGNG